MCENVSREALIAELYARAQECDNYCNKRHTEALSKLEAAKTAALNSVSREEYTQPHLISDESWAARTVVCATNCVAYSLNIPGGGSSMSGEPCRRLRLAEEACNEAAKAVDRVPQETRYVKNEADVLRRLASDLRMHRLGKNRKAKDL